MLPGVWYGRRFQKAGLGALVQRSAVTSLAPDMLGVLGSDVYQRSRRILLSRREIGTMAAREQTQKSTPARPWRLRKRGNMVERLIRPALFLAGVMFAGLVMSELPDTPAGYAMQGGVLWLAMYPFAMEMQVPRRSYWLLLAVGLPVGIAARYSGRLEPTLRGATLTLFAISLVVIVVRRVRRLLKRQP